MGNNNETENKELNDDNTDPQFRRQQFDRTSVLRHSKKRKKSSASNPNSPAVNGTPAFNGTQAVNGTPAVNGTRAVNGTPGPDTYTPAPATMIRNENSSTSFVNNDLPDFHNTVVKEIDFDAVANEQDDALEIQDEQPMEEIFPEIITNGHAEVSFEKPQVIEIQAEPVKPDEPLSASARVAALLAGPALPAPKARAASPIQEATLPQPPPTPPVSDDHPEFTPHITPTNSPTHPSTL